MAGTRETLESVLGNRFDAGAAPATVTEYDRQYASSDFCEAKTTVSAIVFMGRNCGRTIRKPGDRSLSKRQEPPGREKAKPLRGVATSKSRENVSTCWKSAPQGSIKTGSG